MTEVAIGIWIAGATMFAAYGAIVLVSDPDPSEVRKGARALIFAPVWPVVTLMLSRRLWRLADWGHK